MSNFICFSFILTVVGFSLVFVLTVGVPYLFKRLTGRELLAEGQAPITNEVSAPPVGASACPVCGEALPGDSPLGLCPQCLLQCALSQSDPAPVPEEAGARTTPWRAPSSAPAAAELAAILPQLEILELIGQGGMGAVYLARQPKLDRLVAVKILPAEWGQDPAFAERFAREARALARLSHPHIVAVHDFGEAGGQFYLVMEYVDGGNLRRMLQGGRLAPRQALQIVPQICSALQYAHEEGVVHRDIKPENILLDRRGQVKIVDFGLAKLTRRGQVDYSLTGSRQIMGTLDYMAPEQRTAPQDVDHRADIYALGVVLYEMVTGELPLGRFAPPSQRAAVSPQLDEVVYRALEREPALRYQRISDIKVDIEAITRQAAVAVPAPRRARRPANRLLARVRSAVGGMLTLIVHRPTAAQLSEAESNSPHTALTPMRPARKTDRQLAPARGRILAPVAVLILLPVVLCVGVCVGASFFGSPVNWGNNYGGVGPVAALEEHKPQGEKSVQTVQQTAAPALAFYRGDLSLMPLDLYYLQQIDKILTAADKTYLEIEAGSTKKTFVEINKHVMVTVAAFPEELKTLEDRVWVQLEVVLQKSDINKVRKLLMLRGSLFPLGQQPVTIEITYTGTEYIWRVDNREFRGPALPREYERFWRP